MPKKCRLEDPSTSNMVNGPKHFSKLTDNTSSVFIDPCQRNSGTKSLAEWYAKSEDCLLLYWPPMTSVVFLKERIYCNIFRCNNLWNEKIFLNFFFHVINLATFFNFYKKKMRHITDFWTDGLQNMWLVKCLKSPLSEDASKSDMVNRLKHC